jgi:hypothetical protein
MTAFRTTLSTALLLAIPIVGVACSQETCATLEGNPIGKVAVAASELVLAPSLTCAAYDNNGANSSPAQIQPGASAQSLKQPGGACAKAAGDDACMACVKESCCAEAAAVVLDDGSDDVINCILIDKSAGGDGASCGTTPALDALRACEGAHCAACTGSK